MSPLGKQLVAEANRLGIVLDASHASDDVLDQLIELSKSPILLSHSGCKALFDHPRNVDDARLRKLAASGGVIQINSLGAYLKALPVSAERKLALAQLEQEYGDAEALTPERAAAYRKARNELNHRYPPVRATFDDYMRHLLHALEVAGPEHVGIGADWDGGGGVEGLDDVSQLPKITARLLQAGYTRAQIADIWSGNVLRVMRQAEAQRSAR
ncbi:MAG: membrane dipeptidase [Steroidobacteraceae bacterium]